MCYEPMSLAVYVPAGGMVEGGGIGAPLDAAQERRLPQSLTSSFYSRSFGPAVTSSRPVMFKREAASADEFRARGACQVQMQEGVS